MRASCIFGPMLTYNALRHFLVAESLERYPGVFADHYLGDAGNPINVADPSYDFFLGRVHRQAPYPEQPVCVSAEVFASLHT